MPVYEFECQECQTRFFLQASFVEYAAQMKEKKNACPKCQSTKVARVFTPPGIGSSSASKRCGACCCSDGKCG